MFPLSALVLVVLPALAPLGAPPAPAPTNTPPPARVAEDVACESVDGDTPATARQDSTEAAAPLDPAVDAFLDRLEANGETLRTLTADVTYWKYEDLLARSVIRLGTLIASIDPEADDKRFAILFTHVVRGTRRQQTNMNYIFDGHYLAEVDYAQKVCVVHELVEPGKRLDPLRLGEGPIPLPIAQRKDDILARFAPTMLDLPLEGPLARLAERSLVGLRLTPLDDSSEGKTWRFVDIFYDADTLLPVGIEVHESNGDRRTIILSNERRNPELSGEETLRLTVDPPDQGDGWMIDRRSWKDR
jgi:hypothetical protein